MRIDRLYPPLAQPEDSFGGQFGRELRVLRDLSNADKHRVLAVIAGVVRPGHGFHNTPEGTESGVLFRMTEDWQQAEIEVPADRTFGPYQHEFDAEVHVAEAGNGFGSPILGLAH